MIEFITFVAIVIAASIAIEVLTEPLMSLCGLILKGLEFLIYNFKYVVLTVIALSAVGELYVIL